MMLKAFDIELRNVTLDRKVEVLKEKLDETQTRLNELPTLQREYVELSREIATKDSQRNDIGKKLALLRRAYDSDDTDFTTVSDASIPTAPTESNRKIICAAIALLGCALGFVLILGLELFDTTIKTEAELELKLGLPVLGSLRKLSKGEVLVPGYEESAFNERFNIISRRIRQAVPNRGARILVVSAAKGEGKTMCVANLAACLGRQDERVLVMDAQVREGDSDITLRDFILPDGHEDEEKAGLGEYLSFEKDDVNEIVWPTILPGVECLPRVEQAVIPDLLGANRMRELTEEVSKRFSVVFLDAAPMLHYVDAELLAQWVDAVIFVVRSRTMSASALRRAVERIEATEVPVVGAILNGVDRHYL